MILFLAIHLKSSLQIWLTPISLFVDLVDPLFLHNFLFGWVTFFFTVQEAHIQGHPTNTTYIHKARTLKLNVHNNGYIKVIPPIPVISIKLRHWNLLCTSMDISRASLQITVISIKLGHWNLLCTSMGISRASHQH